MKRIALVLSVIVSLMMTGFVASAAPAAADTITNPDGSQYEEVTITANGDTGEISVTNPAVNPTSVYASVVKNADYTEWDALYVSPGTTGILHGNPAFGDGRAEVYVDYSNDFNTDPVRKQYLVEWTTTPTPILVTPTKPAQAGNVVTIPSVTGVTYLVSGAPVTGQYTLTQNTTVNAQPNEGYAFSSGTVSSWSYVYTPPRVTVTSATLKFVRMPTSRKPGKVVLTLKSATGVPVTGKAVLYIKRSGVTKKIAVTVSGTNTAIRVPKLRRGVWAFQGKFLGNSRFTAKNTKIYKVRIRR